MTFSRFEPGLYQESGCSPKTASACNWQDPTTASSGTLVSRENPHLNCVCLVRRAVLLRSWGCLSVQRC